MTPHIESKKEDIAKVVLMPGDPLRAKYIAENFLKDYRLVNSVRNVLAYTGYYKDKMVTVFASGMGIPSMGIYSYELFKFYDVDCIIRIGSAGSYTENLDLYDVFLVESSYSESTYADIQSGYKEKIINSSEEVNKVVIETANNLGINLKRGRVHSSDVFYKENNEFQRLYDEYNCSLVEMETFSLFNNSRLLGKKASAIVTVSDNLVTKKETTSLERQNSFTTMMHLALESIIRIN